MNTEKDIKNGWKENERYFIYKEIYFIATIEDNTDIKKTRTGNKFIQQMSSYLIRICDKNNTIHCYYSSEENDNLIGMINDNDFLKKIIDEKIIEQEKHRLIIPTID